jgi:SIT family siderophore-iron:H+ symporter-like MFS transporter
MWAIIFPACCIPLFFVLFSAELRAKRQGLLNDVPSPVRMIFKDSSVLKDLFWQTDLVGLILLAATLALILLPFTL